MNVRKAPDPPSAVAWHTEKEQGFKILYISEDTWCASIYVLFGCTDDTFKRWMKEVWGRDDKEMGHHYLTTEIRTETGASADVIAFRDSTWTWSIQQMATLVHECHHATTNMLMRKGLVHTRETEEAWAYLQDSLYSRICWAIKNEAKIRKINKFTDHLFARHRLRPKLPKKRPLAKKPRKK